MENINIFDNLKDSKKIKKEIEKLKGIFENLDEDSKAINQGLFERASYLVVLIELLENHMKEHGVKDVYKNGKEQYGYKQSVESEHYHKCYKSYLSTVKELNSQLNKCLDRKLTRELAEKKKEPDDFERFLSGDY